MQTNSQTCPRRPRRPAAILSLAAAALLTLATGGGCSLFSGDQSSTAKKIGSCTAGQRACSCDGGACDGGLRCDAGYCVPSGCQAGADGCGCFADGSCDVLDGVPMHCGGNICAASVEAAAGNLGGACASGSACQPFEGRAARCLSGVCELADCPAGYLGCPCESYGGCAPYGNREVRCSIDNTCMIGDCSAGTAGCTCDGGHCGAGLLCDRGVCLNAARLTLQVNDPTVRSCEVVLYDAGNSPARVLFSDAVEGRFEQKLPKTAILFLSRGDRAISGAAATVESIDGSPLPRAQLQPITSNCYDVLGQPVAGNPLTIQ